MTALGEHLHALGLKFGLYTVWGSGTCASTKSRPFHGSWGHEAQDAKTFARWGVVSVGTFLICARASNTYELVLYVVRELTKQYRASQDYLKEDSCGGPDNGTLWERYALMRVSANDLLPRLSVLCIG